MKVMKFRCLTLVCLSLILASSSLVSANEYTYNVREFNGLNITSYFNVTLVSGTEYSVSGTVDKDLYDYVKCEVACSILNLTYDEKSLPKEVKSAHKGKPEFFFTITVPSSIQSINISGKSTLDVKGGFGGENVSINAVDQANVRNIEIDDCGTVNISLDKKSTAHLDVSAKDIAVLLSGNSELDLTQSSSSLSVSTTSSSSVVVRGDTESLKVESKGASKIILNGHAKDSSFNIGGTSNTNASNLESENVDVTMNGLCVLSVSAKDNMKISSMNGGASLDYMGDPAVSIVTIKNSSVTHN